MRQLNKHLLSENIEKAAQYDLIHNKIFGSAYCVFQEGNLCLEQCYGVCSPNSDQPIDGNTLFRLASMTKPITAMAVLILADRGQLSLDDPVDRYLPEFHNIRILDSSGKELGMSPNKPTVRSLLCHTSGIGCSDEKLLGLSAEDKRSLEAYVAFFVKAGLDFEPWSRQLYSGTGAFDVLSKIIEVTSQKSFSSFLQDEIFDPCNMADTTFEPTGEQWEKLARMHNKKNGRNTVYQMREGCVFEDFPCGHHLGGAGLVSSLRDYCNFARMLLNQGRIGQQQLLSKKTFDLLCIPHVSKDIMSGSERWGLGVRVITDGAYPFLPVGSFGWSGAYGSHFWIDPVNRIYAVFMKNSKFDGGSANESARNFEKAVYSSF